MSAACLWVRSAVQARWRSTPARCTTAIALPRAAVARSRAWATHERSAERCVRRLCQVATAMVLARLRRLWARPCCQCDHAARRCAGRQRAMCPSLSSFPLCTHRQTHIHTHACCVPLHVSYTHERVQRNKRACHGTNQSLSVLVCMCVGIDMCACKENVLTWLCPLSTPVHIGLSPVRSSGAVRGR